MKKTMHLLLIIAFLAGVLPLFAQSQTRSRALSLSSRPDGVSAKDVRFFSEGIECHGRIFTPKEFQAEGKTPAVVLAPGWGETAASIEKYGAQFASRGLVAMIIDYRGWGKSGGFIQTVDAVKTDDRLRFSQMTARVRIRRKRLIPQQQVLDIRNALYYLQGEPGVDRARVGVWGTGMSGGHVIVVAATDSRIKAAVAQTPMIGGKDVTRKASAPTGALLKAEFQRARTGQATPNGSLTSADLEARLALSEYHPFWYVEQIPKTTAVLFVIAENDPRANNDNGAIAASKLLKGPTDVVRLPAAFENAAKAAVDWFLKHL